MRFRFDKGRIAMHHEDLAKALFEIGAFEFGAFRLKLHEKQPTAPLSPFYINLRVLRSFPNTMRLVVPAYEKMSESLTFDLFADIPTSATPLVAVLSFITRIPMITPRSDAKSHGLTSMIDGVFKEGQKVLLVDDLVTTADSKLEVIKQLEDSQLIVSDIMVLIDRQQQGVERLRNAGYLCHAAFTVTELLDFYFGEHLVTKAKYDEALRYLRDQSLKREG